MCTGADPDAAPKCKARRAAGAQLSSTQRTQVTHTPKVGERSQSLRDVGKPGRMQARDGGQVQAQ